MGECKELTQMRSGDDGICLSGDLWALKGKRRQFNDGGEGVWKKLWVRKPRMLKREHTVEKAS